MISYRKANINDLDLIVNLENKCFNQYDSFSKKNIRHMIANPNHSCMVELIIYEKSSIVGYAIFLTKNNSKKIRLYSICISPDLAGKNYGKFYLQHRINELSKDYIRISLEVRESNSRAIHLYKGLGFEIIKRLKQYYPDGEEGLKLERLLK